MTKGSFALSLLLLAGAACAAPARYMVQADVVRGAPGAQGAVCVANSVFYPGESVVWRVRVSDAATGKPLTAAQVKQLGVTAQVKLDNGVTQALNFEGHPPSGKNAEYFFAGGWQTTAKTPTGTLKWTAVVKDKAGNTATFEPIGQNVGLAALTIAPKSAGTK